MAVFQASRFDDVVEDYFDGNRWVYFDTLSYGSGVSRGQGVKIDLKIASIQYTGGSGYDTISASGIRQLIGSSYDDTLLGSEFDDTILGGRGNDCLDGRNDHDFLYGNSGNDTLIGGKGNDILRGGPGNDVFKYNSREDSVWLAWVPGDTITDFTSNDKIDLSAVDASPFVSGNQVFTWVGSLSTPRVEGIGKIGAFYDQSEHSLFLIGNCFVDKGFRICLQNVTSINPKNIIF